MNKIIKCIRSKHIYTITFTCLALSGYGQFKDTTIVNGITYKATVNNDIHVTYVQQDYLDFSLAADSFYIDVMTDAQWDASSDLIVSSGGVWSNGMYHLPNGSQVFVSDQKDPDTGNLMIVTLFESVDSEF